jgi:hypothetical protein
MSRSRTRAWEASDDSRCGYGFGSCIRPDASGSTVAFIDRLKPAPDHPAFYMADHWIWCGSVIRGDDGRYHMFASRWPRTLRFAPHWLTNSEIVRAVADRPEGPFKFAEIVLPARGENFWDGRMTHNPTVHRLGSTYLLFYAGSTFSGWTPAAASQARARMPFVQEARRNQRIGLATAPSLEGPWERRDHPILEPRAGQWDALMTTNPAPCVLANGSVLLVYKSTGDADDLLRMGAARADRPEGPYERATDEELFAFTGPGEHVEDAYVWHEDGRFQLIMKDINGGLSGETGAGVHAMSGDGITWSLSPSPKAYSLTLPFVNGNERTFARVERPQLLIEDGRPRMLYLAVAESNGRKQVTSTWNQAVPLRG